MTNYAYNTRRLVTQVSTTSPNSTQSEYTYNTTTTESVSFDHYDAAGMSYRSTRSDGSVVVADGSFDGQPGELDPLGGNAGLSIPYIELVTPPPPDESFPFFPIYGDSPMYVNGQQVTCSLDGMSVSCASAFRSLENGSAIPAGLAGLQNLPGFSFNSHGLGIFSVTLPDIFRNSSGETWAQPHGTRGDGWRIVEGGSSIYSISWGISLRVSWSPRRITEEEAIVLKTTVTATADAVDGCRKYIRDLLEEVAAVSSYAKLISTDIETLFDTIKNSSSGGIYLRQRSGGSVPDYYKIEVGIGNPYPRSAGLSRASVATTVNRYIFNALTDPGIALVTIHELMHAATSVGVFTDEDFAYAAARLAKVDSPIFSPYDATKPTSATNRPEVFQASEYWGDRLNQACGLASQITNKYTTHKLY